MFMSSKERCAPRNSPKTSKRDVLQKCGGQIGLGRAKKNIINHNTLRRHTCGRLARSIGRRRAVPSRTWALRSPTRTSIPCASDKHDPVPLPSRPSTATLAFLLVHELVAVIPHVPISFTTRKCCLSSHSAGHADVPCVLRAQRLEMCCKLFLQAQTGQRKPMNRPNTRTFGRQHVLNSPVRLLLLRHLRGNQCITRSVHRSSI